MPRTEFVTLYAQVKGTLPGSVSLYNLVKVLACYKNDGDDVEYAQLQPFFIRQLTYHSGLTLSSVTALLMLRSLKLILMGSDGAFRTQATATRIVSW